MTVMDFFEVGVGDVAMDRQLNKPIILSTDDCSYLAIQKHLNNLGHVRRKDKIRNCTSYSMKEGTITLDPSNHHVTISHNLDYNSKQRLERIVERVRAKNDK